MSSVKISQLPVASTVSASADALPIVHAGVTQKVTPALLVQSVLPAPGAIGGTTPAAGAFTTLSASGATTLNGTTIPASKTLVTLADTQTLTSKTINLASNTLTGTIAEFNTACSDADFVSNSSTTTFTNKSINLANNTLTGTITQFNTACSDADFATLTGSESLTNKSISATGQIKSSSTSAGIGYASGAGSTVTQSTNRTNPVTINNICGEIITVSATTTAGLVVEFTVNNSTVTSKDTVIANVAGSPVGKYILTVTKVATGSFVVQTFTPAAVLGAESITINFSVIKSVNA